MGEPPLALLRRRLPLRFDLLGGAACCTACLRGVGWEIMRACRTKGDPGLKILCCFLAAALLAACAAQPGRSVTPAAASPAAAQATGAAVPGALYASTYQIPAGAPVLIKNAT